MTESNANTLSIPISENNHRLRIKHSFEQAEKYHQRKKSKHIAEMTLISRALQSLNPAPHSFLDAPCGVGRATVFLAERGYQTTGIDLGNGAIQSARQQIDQSSATATIEKADLVDLPYRNNQFDAVLCFRLIHHLPTSAHRQQIIAELCRVSGRYVLISYLSPWSFTSAKRFLRQKLTGKKSLQHITPRSEINNYFASQGFSRLIDFAQMPLLHSLHLAVFTRQT